MPTPDPAMTFTPPTGMARGTSLDEARRRWQDASARELARLLVLPVAERAALGDEAVADLTDADRAAFYRRLALDGYRAGRRDATVVRVGRLRRRLRLTLAHARRSVAAAGGRVSETLDEDVALPALVPTPVVSLARSTWRWWPIPLTILASLILERWAALMVPAGVDPLRWVSTAADIGPTLTWLGVVLVAGLGLRLDLRWPVTLCAILQAVASLGPLGSAVGAVLGALDGHGLGGVDGYAATLAGAAAVVGGHAAFLWLRRRPDTGRA